MVLFVCFALCYLFCFVVPGLVLGKLYLIVHSHGGLELVMDAWCSVITSSLHAEGPGIKSQCVHLCNTFLEMKKVRGL